jgi:hypothetical protein
MIVELQIGLTKKQKAVLIRKLPYMANKGLDPLMLSLSSAGVLAAPGLDEGGNTAPKTKTAPWDS